ncbi:MAG: TRIC cation channel family protein [Candidatus Acidiferrales bacterium]
MTQANNEIQAALIRHDRLLSVADIAGTFLFAIEGATAAVTGDLDLLGLMVLAFSTALAGGITRDLLIGAVPPQSLRDWRYPTVAFTGAAIVFLLHPLFENLPTQPLIVLDAGALALFAVAGTEKALKYKMHPFVAALLGTITAVGGGTIRDIFLAQISNGRYAVRYSWRVVVFRDSLDQRVASLESAARSHLMALGALQPVSELNRAIESAPCRRRPRG